jgi:hypothetical protein
MLTPSGEVEVEVEGNTPYCGNLLSLLAGLAAFWMARFVVAAISKPSKGVIRYT